MILKIFIYITLMLMEFLLNNLLKPYIYVE